YEALIEQASQFDFYDGGGLDIAFLSFAEGDGSGNVNVSRFGGKPNGSGGFIHIAQNSKTICFLGALTAGGLLAVVQDGRLRIKTEGRHRRFVRTIQQCTYNRRGGLARGQKALFIKDRVVIEAEEYGLMVVEISHRIDLQRDVLANFQICPRVYDRLGLMPEF